MCHMVYHGHTLHQHIVYVDLHSLPDLSLEHLVHEALICGSSVLETERHHPVAVGALRGDE